MEHGVVVDEIATGAVPAVQTLAGLPTYFGTAPINLGDPLSVGKPVLCENLADFVAAFGPISPPDQWGKWTLHEAAAAHFLVFNIGPIVCVNVIDPTNADHFNVIANQLDVLDSDGNLIVEEYGSGPAYGVLKSTLVVHITTSGGALAVLGTDYTLAFDDDGHLVLSRVVGGAIGALAHLYLSWHELDPDGVVVDDILGAYVAGKYTGIEVADQVFAKLRMPPGILLAPKWSQTPSVAAKLGVKAALCSGQFKCLAGVDLSTDPAEIPTYADAPAWAKDNGYNTAQMLVGWPLWRNGTQVFHAATIAACALLLVDADNGGVPFASPSSRLLVGTGGELDNGDEVLLTQPQANSLNAQGIVTFLNGVAGWKLWGNRTGIYPASTDPKDCFIPIRRMFNYVNNTTILTIDRDVDQPGNKRLINAVLGTIGSWLNGLAAVGALVGVPTVQFRKDENPLLNLADGKFKFHDTITPPSPAEAIEFVVEYDPTQLAALFA